MKPVIGITMGDPAGIGPEIIIKTLLSPRIKNRINPVIFGNKKVFIDTIKKLRLKNSQFLILNSKFIDCVPDLKDIKYGKVNALYGKASILCVKEAVGYALSKKS